MGGRRSHVRSPTKEFELIPKLSTLHPTVPETKDAPGSAKNFELRLKRFDTSVDANAPPP